MQTAARECEEEVGLAVDPAELRRIFTGVTSNAGSTEAHGAFTDNEYVDVYL